MKRLLLLILLLCVAVPVLAQSNSVTDDDVRDVAEGMYCPICENEPLDDCRNVTCLQWKAEIRRMLGEGMSEDAIVDDFIARYGDQVVGVPPSPFLRALSLGLPVLILIGALVVGWMTFSRWRGPAKTDESIDVSPASTTEDDAYREMLERDLG